MECLNCKCEIEPPKRKYCSRRCKEKYLWNKNMEDPDFRKRRVGYMRKYRLKNLVKVNNARMSRYHGDEEYREMEKIRRRHNHRVNKDKCALCGVLENLELHHYDYSEDFNGIVVCKPCHWAIHMKRTANRPP